MARPFFAILSGMSLVFQNLFPRGVIALSAIILVATSTEFLHASAELTSIANARLVPADWADGDSFLVEFSDPTTGAPRKETFRLYGVDCMETRISFDSDRRRLREQARHFGVENPSDLIAKGEAATKFVQSILKNDFTVHTGFAKALGRSSRPRYYAYITTAGGEDLSTLLVRKGLARAKGISRERPDGTSRDEYAAGLADLELAAAMDRSGVWKLSNSSRIAALRADKRREDRELAAIQKTPNEFPLDINTASQAQLENLPGIGAVLAARIIKKRPYRTIEDLDKIKGLNEPTLQRIKPLLQVSRSSRDQSGLRPKIPNTT
jgi:competence protein ComEA